MRLRWNVDTVIIQMNCNTLQSLPGALVNSSRAGIWDLVFQVQPAGRPVTHGWSVCLFCCLSALQLRIQTNTPHAHQWQPTFSSWWCWYCWGMSKRVWLEWSPDDIIIRAFSPYHPGYFPPSPLCKSSTLFQFADKCRWILMMYINRHCFVTLADRIQ